MSAWFEMRPVGLNFLDDGPMRFEVAVQTSLSREQCWAAFSDAAGWSAWFPGVREAGYRTQALPYGVGTIRTAEVNGVRFEETILAWDELSRWIYRIDRCTAELATAQVEATLFEERPGGGTQVVWILVSDPCPLMAAAADALPGILEQKLTEAMRNLEVHRRGVASPAIEERSP